MNRKFIKIRKHDPFCMNKNCHVPFIFNLVQKKAMIGTFDIQRFFLFEHDFQANASEYPENPHKKADPEPPGKKNS